MKNEKLTLPGIMHSVQKPGADEAKTIKRTFEWQSKIREVHRGLDEVARDFKSAAAIKDDTLKSTRSFDPIETVREVEDWAKSQFEPLEKKKAVNAYSFAKLNKALDLISRRIEDPVHSQKRFDKPSRNDWTHFEKLESERRAFIEASYRRYRIGEIDRPPCPKPEYFDYDRIEMKDSSSTDDKPIDQPIAFAKRFDLRKAYDEELNLLKKSTPVDEIRHRSVGMEKNEDIRCDLPPRPSAHAANYNCPVQREAYVSQLVSNKAAHRLCSTLTSGQNVSVCYYGVHFPGIVLQRNIGNGTIRVQFDDGTVNDFPLHCIVVEGVGVDE
jgi:hypothetical protein